MLRVTKQCVSSSSQEQAKWGMKRVLENQRQYVQQATKVSQILKLHAVYLHVITNNYGSTHTNQKSFFTQATQLYW
jgi:hypothetical protein